VHVGEELHRGDRRDDRLRYDDIAKAQRGKEHLRERADVHDAAGAIETLHRFDRAPFIAELAVVVVFHDECVCVFCPAQELQPSRQ
jgi:hypothetical protein